MKNPLQLKFEFALWIHEMVTKLIQNKFGIKLSADLVGRLLHNSGSPARSHCGVRRTRRGSDAAVAHDASTPVFSSSF
ncbi:MAG: hypothetical protein ACREDM_09285 [Methylocella sp.]